ncbi:MAG: hypothetical protein M3135_03830 [Actinomycetota bacterium]|nr:hypothetical protein [Actinomycetota bacterium]
MGRWMFIVVGVGLLVGLFLLLRPDPAPVPGGIRPTATTTPRPTETSTESPTPEPTGTLDAVEIEVEEGRVEGPGRISVTQGDRVAIEVKADTSDHVHVHGYDILADVAPDEEVVLRFRADIPGIFEIELEGSGLLLTTLEVAP